MRMRHKRCERRINAAGAQMVTHREKDTDGETKTTKEEQRKTKVTDNQYEETE